METSELVQYGLIFIGVPLALYMILRVLGIVGSKAPAIVEGPERGTTGKVSNRREHVLF